jgi:hypothetical protein
LQEQGWQPNPDAPPVAVYHLWRPVQQHGVSGHGGVSIDDSKVHIIKGGSNGHGPPA